MTKYPRNFAGIFLFIEHTFDFWTRLDYNKRERRSARLDRMILHCDCNCFYASVELLSHPELAHLPVAVCGDPSSRHGIILAKNEPAKAFGVKTAETIWQARRKCPDLVLLPSHHDLYGVYSRKINEIYESYTDLVEPFGIDESWLDVTGTIHLFGGDPVALADSLRRRIREELGLTISVGVSFNKIFAKLGSDYRKPDATTAITRDSFQSLVWPLPAGDLLYAGRAATKLLSQYGVHTIGDLATFDREALSSLLGKQGDLLWRYANGLDDSPVLPSHIYTPPKSVGNGETFPKDLTTAAELHRGVVLLADNVAARLRKHGLKATTLQVTLRDPAFHDVCRQKPLPAPSCIARELSDCAMELIQTTWKPGAPVRAITITASNLIDQSEAVQQLDLFGSSDDKRRDRLERLERTVDGLRQKYGRDAVHSACERPLPSNQKEKL